MPVMFGVCHFSFVDEDGGDDDCWNSDVETVPVSYGPNLIEMCDEDSTADEDGNARGT